MKTRVLQILAALPGVAMLIRGVGFVFVPEEAVNYLYMELLSGMGRSSQIADVGAVFLGTAIFILLGAWRRSATWLSAGAIMLGLIAVLRIIAWAFHGAGLATEFIVVEVVFVIWLGVLARLFQSAQGTQNAQPASTP